MVPIGSIFASKARKGVFKMFGFVKPDILLLLKTFTVRSSYLCKLNLKHPWATAGENKGINSVY